MFHFGKSPFYVIYLCDLQSVVIHNQNLATAKEREGRKGNLVLACSSFAPPSVLPCDSLLNHLQSVQVQLRVAVGFQFCQFWQLWQFWQSPPSHSLFNPANRRRGFAV